MPRWAKVSVGVIAGIVVLLLLTIFVITQTDFGRERVRSIALDALRGSAHGVVEMGPLRGNLLSGARIDGLVIEDSTGAPFFRADTIAIGYSLRALLRQRIDLSDVRLVRAEVVLDRPPGLAWNFARIFPSDTTQPPTGQGFGAWISIRDLEVVDGRVLVRNEWVPADTLDDAARQKAIADALDPEERLLVVEVPGGYQTIQDFRDLNGHFERLRLADPDSTAIIVDVGQLSLTALPFRPPAAEIRALRGRIISDGDTLAAEGVEVELPGTRLAVDGTYLLSGGLDLAAAASAIDFADLRWLRPDLPDGSGRLDAVRVVMRGERTRLLAEGVDLAMEGATLQGSADVTVGDTLRLGPTELRFAGVETSLITRLAPEVEVPRSGTLGGSVSLSGTPEALSVDGTVSFVDSRGGTSQLLADGQIGTGDGEFHARDLRLRLSPLQLTLVGEPGAPLPVGGAITGDARLTGSTGAGFTIAADLSHRSPQTAASRVLADGSIVPAGDGFTARGLTIRLDPMQVALARAFAPELPLEGLVTGRVNLDGAPENLTLAADLAHESAATGRSRVLANGGVSVAGETSLRNLRIRLDPLQVAVARAFSPDLPVDGVLAGTALVNGSTGGAFSVDADLAHSGSTGSSRLAGTATFPTGGSGRVAADLRVFPLSLQTVGLFAPAAGLTGSATGTARASGTLRDLDLSVAMEVQGGGAVSLDGRLGLGGAEPRYDLDAAFTGFNAGAMSTRAPGTALTGTATVAGRGSDPATMDALLRADLSGVAVDAVQADSISVLASVADGIAAVERGSIRLASAAAEIAGSFGLTSDRTGMLRYSVRVDSLADFAGFLPPDTGAVAPRPAEVAQAIERARADSIRIARATEVERAATGRPLPPRLEVQGIDGLPRDSLSGALEAAGTLSGNLDRFDIEGTAGVERLVAMGNRVERGEATYLWSDAPTEASVLAVDLQLGEPAVAGFRLDSVDVTARYAGGMSRGTGSVALLAVQDEDRDYRAEAEFVLDPERSEVSYSDLTLRFDTVQWQSTRPGTVSWAGSGVEVEGIDLRSDGGGRISAEGTVPAEGEGDLQLAIDGLEVADVLGLLQDTIPLRGLLSLDARLTGSAAEPRIDGDLALRGIVLDTLALPDLEASVDYAGGELMGEARAIGDGQLLLTAEGSLPINLALTGVEGPRLAEGAGVILDVRADSLPLESLPGVTAAVTDVRGLVRGSFSVRGSLDDPDMSGVVSLELGSLGLAQPGIRLEDISGTVRMAGGTVIVDSLVAYSRGGPIRVDGSIELPELSEPEFDLRLEARNARVLDNEQGTISASADMALTGAWDDARIAGDVVVEGGLIRAPELGTPQRAEIDAPDVIALGDTAAVQLVAGNPFLTNLEAEVNVIIARDTWVRNSAANIEVFTPEDGDELVVQMDGGPETLALNGTISIDRGEYTFAGRRIRLNQGSVVFLGETPINPILQVTAEQQVRLSGRPDFAIQLLIGGTLSEPRVTVESNAQPPISESDLLSYFAFGESTSSLLQSQSGGSVGGSTSGGGALLGPVGAMATQQLGATAVGVVVDELEQGARNSLGLDVLNITPAPVPPELAVQGYLNAFRGAQFEAGAYLGDRWFVVGQGRAAPVLPGMRLEYRTPAGFQWITSLEPRYLVPIPSLGEQETETERVLGVFLQWRRRF